MGYWAWRSRTHIRAAGPGGAGLGRRHEVLGMASTSRDAGRHVMGYSESSCSAVSRAIDWPRSASDCSAVRRG